MKLYYGSVVVVVNPFVNEGVITSNTIIEHCIAWANSEEECLGGWIKTIQEKHPESNKSIRKTFIYDCTDYAAQGFTKQSDS